MPLAPGSKLGPYEILSPLGAGGMGEVYRARDPKLKRDVAIKVLPPALANDAGYLARFQREAQALAALNHPNISAIYGLEGNAIVMELVEGETLKGPLPLKEVLPVARQIAEALEAAHDKGIIHRDLKPGNIKLTPEGVVKVLDFGLAKSVERKAAAGADSPTLTMRATEAGVILGTAGYMSPEQAAGKPVDRRADIWSFGVVLYELLTGKRLFDGETVSDTLADVLRADIDFGKIPEGPVRELIRRCLDRNLKNRLSHIGEARYMIDNYGTQPAVALADRYQHVDDLVVDLRALKAPGAGSRRRGMWLAATLPVVATAAAFWFYQPAPRIDSLAVLPIANDTADPSSDYISEGLSESLITSLSRLPGLKIPSRDSVFRYWRKNADKDLRQVGRDLGVRAVLKGRLWQRGESLAMSAELVDTRDGSIIWRDQYSRKLADLAQMEPDMAQEITRQLRVRLSGDQQRRLAKAATRSPEAYQLYLQGRYFWNRRSKESLFKSVEYFQQATAKDPGYALAWSGLADSYITLGGTLRIPPADAFQRGVSAANRAIELDESLAGPHAALGRMKMFYEWDWEGGEKQLRRALTLDPAYATARQWYASHLVSVGRFQEAVNEMRRARVLDPQSAIITADVGLLSYYARQYPAAIEAARTAVEMDPGIPRPHMYLGMFLAVQNQRTEVEAVQEMNKALELSQHGVFETAWRGAVLGRLGRRDEARSALAKLQEFSGKQYVAAVLPAIVLAAMGEKNSALDSFEKAFEERSISPWILRDPLIDGIRDEPRFKLILSRMKLPIGRYPSADPR